MAKATPESHEHTHATDSYFLSADAWSKVRNSLAFVALVSWVSLAAGFVTNRDQFYFSYLVAFVFFVSITLGALFFVMVQHLTGSAWSVTVRRLMETMIRAIPLGLVLFLPVIFGLQSLFEWSRMASAKDPVLSQKLSYLNETWFVIRSYLVLGIWSLFGLVLYRQSRAQDTDSSLVYTRRAHNWSAPGVLVLFVTASIAAFDWIMSLEGRWFSTMFGVTFLSGGALGFMALLIIIVLSLRSAGYLTHAVNEEHYHDLGKWLFCFVAFWGYVCFSQYMLIWYGNLPEETFWFKHRFAGSWLGVSFLILFGHFLFPFFALLPRAAKRNLKSLGFFAGWMLVMHYVDLYWQAMPVFHKQGFSLHWLDFAALLAVGSSYGLVFWSAFREKPLVPVGDPRLEQCLAFHNA
jgi:hypothetical protein